MGKTIGQLPLHLLGLNNIPAIPLVPDELPGTLLRLLIRELETQPASRGLSAQYTIQGQTATALQFLFGSASHQLADVKNDLLELLSDEERVVQMIADVANDTGARLLSEAQSEPLTSLSLESADQWAISWTTYWDIYNNGLKYLSTFSSTLSDLDTAEQQFWSSLAVYGVAYNLLLPQKVGPDLVGSIRAIFQSVWSEETEQSLNASRLYVIDLRVFETVQPQVVSGFVRFAPATVTLLQQDPLSKALMPVAVQVSGYQGAGVQVYSRASATAGAWLYALQAAKTSVTVYGIWLGHVYHWHIPSATLQMTMNNTIPADHPIALLLAPQSKYLMAFNNFLLLFWPYIAPPTAISTGRQFLELLNTFAADRTFFDDDPFVTLERHGISQADFTRDQLWDGFPIVRYYQQIWDATARYIDVFVDTSYADDAAVASDAALQAWIVTSGSSSDQAGGNIRGLPHMNSKAALHQVLTSLVYRITMHGIARLNSTANPVLTFVANFPPCLQSSAIPEPQTSISLTQLLAFLPKTGTIGNMVTFYFTFTFSEPYESFVPKAGVEANLFFPNGMSDPRNQALVQFRTALVDFITVYEADQPQTYQWPLNIET